MAAWSQSGQPGGGRLVPRRRITSGQDPQSQSRRQFLGQAGLVAGGVVIGLPTMLADAVWGAPQVDIGNFPVEHGFTAAYLSTYNSTVLNGRTIVHGHAVDVPGDMQWVVAPVWGTVRFSFASDTGYMASLVDDAGKTHRMMHMHPDERQIQHEARRVPPGTRLGRISNTGATGGFKHLHYDYNFKNSPVPFASMLTWGPASGPDQDRRTTHAVRSTTAAPPQVAQFAGHLVQWADERPSPVTTWLVGPDLRRTHVADGGAFSWFKSAGAPGPDRLSSPQLDALPDRIGVRATTDQLGVNWVAPRGTSIWSTTNGYLATLQGDGNFVVYAPGSRAVFATMTNAVRIVMQGDGNLVLYDASNRAVWQSGTSGHGSSRLVMQPDGNLVVYRADGRAIWHTGTNGGTNRMSNRAGFRI